MKKMDKTLTLGSLFDGIGGFPLCAEKNEIKTLWASEIEPFPIAVSKQHLPATNFYGDIKSLKGKYLEKVDIITAGSPCQDVSIAGKRAGLSGNRSGLFMEMIRIIKEMREIESKTKFEEKEIKPRILLWENVPGVFSSNKGQDFRTILEQICRIKDKTISIPMPAKNKWNKSGCIVGNNFSLAWRVLNAQYFGVAQRRKRVFLVADFGGQSAPKILFEPYCLSRDTSKSTKERENFAISCETSIRKTSKDSNIKYNEVARNNTLSVLPFDTSFCTYLNSHNNPKYGDLCHTLSANSHIPKIAINHNYQPKNKNVYCLATSQVNSEIIKNLSPTLTSSAGTSGNNKPWITVSQTSYSTYLESDTSVSLKNSGGTLGGGSENLSIRDDVIRKLTPLECERLQGFPDNWTCLETKKCMSDEEYYFWLEVYNNDKILRNKTFLKDISKDQLLKWYNKLKCDNSRYKALGNSIAIPCVDFIIKRIKDIAFKKSRDKK